MLPRYPCFETDEDWIGYCELAQDEHIERKKSRKGFTRNAAGRAACEDCSVFLQGIATLNDRCYPVPGAITPQMRALAGMPDDADDEPWPTLELPE